MACSVSSVPSLMKVCVVKIVEEIRELQQGVDFDDLGKYKFVIGPFENLCKY